MKILLGLGNPCRKYQNTPHNVGFYLIDSMAKFLKWRRDKRSLTQKITLGCFPVLLAKPTTYVNLSGEAVHALLSFYKIPLNDLIVVVDDANLNLGAIRIRPKGSDGGHKGLKSIIQHCGSDFARIRIGVGPCPPEMDLSYYVLKKLNKEQASVIDNIKSCFNELVIYGLEHGWKDAATKYNRTSHS
jgi:PTH1 family peptidyl-tRNA hydrolase